MKHPHRFCEPYPENPRSCRVKSNGRTKIELDLKDAHQLADLLKEISFDGSDTDFQLYNLLIKKLRNAEPEMQF